MEAAVGDAPLKLGKDSEIIDVVLKGMAEYREGGVFTSHEPEFVLVDQKTA